MRSFLRQKYFISQRLYIFRGVAMLELFEIVILAVFVCGIFTGAFVAKMFGGNNVENKDAPKTSTSVTIPDTVFLSRAGKCFHLKPKCRLKESSVALTEFKLCQHCENELVKAHRKLK